MNSVKKSLLLLTILLLVLVPSVLGQDETADTVPETVEADSRLDTLAAALKETGLYETLLSGEWTLFAPTDQAFAEMGLTPENIATEMTVEELLDLLQYHLLSGDLSTATLKTKLGNIDMENGRLAGLSFYEDDIYVNDLAKVIEANIIAENGTVHVVDNVVQGPWPRVEAAAQTVDEALGEITDKVTEQMETGEEAAEETTAAAETTADTAATTTDVVEVAEETTAAPPITSTIPENSIAGVAVVDGRFDTVMAAAVAAGLIYDLADGEWTAFVPTDEAFAKHGLSADNIASTYSQEELADLLLYHLMKGNNSTAQLKTQLGNVTMANGQQAGLKFYEDHIYVNDDAMVIEENIITDNGTIHVVDNLILPPWPRIDAE